MTATPAHTFEEIDLSAGHGVASSHWFRADLIANLDNIELLPHSEWFRFYWSMAGSWWNWSNGPDSYAIGLIPLLRIGKSEGSLGALYLELGFGPYLFANISGSNRHLSTAFEFGSHAGIGMKISEQLGVQYRYYHYSNGGIAHPNGGMNVHMAGLTYRF